MPPLRITSLTLYHAQLSGCSARVRTALLLKFPSSSPAPFPITYHQLSISDKDHHSPAYTAINPNRSVPSLVVTYVPPPPAATFTSKPSIASLLYNSESDKPKDEEKQFTITQSPAILSFIETHFRSPPLLPPPSLSLARSRVLELTSLVACDIQPPQNTRVRAQLHSQYGVDGEDWARWVYRRGLGVFESLVQRGREEAGISGEGTGLRGRFSVGDEITWADIYLVPAVQGALKFGMEKELGEWPAVKGIVESCWEVDAFREAGLGGHGRLVP